MTAVSQHGGIQEYEHQKAKRVVEAVRSLEGFVINGGISASAGAANVMRAMKGIKFTCSSNVTDASSAALTETYFNQRLQGAIENGADENLLNFCLAPPAQKRKMSSWLTPIRRETAAGGETLKAKLGVYDSDFGEILVIMSRWLNNNEIVFGSSSLVKVLPLTGRSFQHYPLATSGSYQRGMVEGEYTCEVRHEEAHGWVYNLAT